MGGRPRGRATALLVACAWGMATTTLLTIFAAVVTDSELDADPGSDVDDVTVLRDGSAGSRYHRYEYKPLERKPQGRDEDYEGPAGAAAADEYGNVRVSRTPTQGPAGGRGRSRVVGDGVVDVGNTSTGNLRRGGAGQTIVEDGIFWSNSVEKSVPAGLSESAFSDYKRKVSHGRVVSLQAATWNRCGRPKNQFVTFEDGSAVCARYRHPQDNLVQGEILSFYLSRMLGMDCVPAIKLSLVGGVSGQWSSHNLSAADWKPGHFVALIQWLDELNHYRSRVRMPPLLLTAYESRRPLSSSSQGLYNATTDQLVSLLQWTDLIVFDYVTGHYDRVASMQDGVDQENNSNILNDSIRNLRQTWTNGKLWLLDNEGGLLDAYGLMYGRNAGPAGARFLEYHRRMLRSTCVFRRRTIDEIRWLVGKRRPDRFVEAVASASDSLYSRLTQSAAASAADDVQLFRMFFGVRLKEVLTWVDHCNSLRER